MKTYKRISKQVEAVEFPNSGPEQHDICKWIEQEGGVAHLYDGCLEVNVKTSTGADWRWSRISIDGANIWAKVGYFIVKEASGSFRVFTPGEFVSEFTKL